MGSSGPYTFLYLSLLAASPVGALLDYDGACGITGAYGARLEVN